MIVIASRPSSAALTIAVACLCCGAARSVSAQPQSTTAESNLGSLCILPHPKPPAADARTGSTGTPPPAESYTMRIDGRTWIPLSTAERVLIVNVPRNMRHRVAIRGDGRPWAAFSFTFDATGPPALCLYQNDFYYWWQMFNVRDSFKSCRCERVKPIEY
jgi:hypothetical protein